MDEMDEVECQAQARMQSQSFFVTGQQESENLPPIGFARGERLAVGESYQGPGGWLQQQLCETGANALCAPDAWDAPDALPAALAPSPSIGQD